MQKSFYFTSLLLFPILSWGQDTMPSCNGYAGVYYLVIDTVDAFAPVAISPSHSSAYSSKAAFGIMNPEYLGTSFMLDSNYRVIHKMKNNQNGYVYYKYYSNGNKKHEEIRLKKDSLYWRDYFDSTGRLTSSSMPISKYRITRNYYDTTGYPIAEIWIRKPKMDSYSSLYYYYSYYKTGIIKEEGILITKPTAYSEYFRLGSWFFYDKIGKIIKEENYKDPITLE